MTITTADGPKKVARTAEVQAPAAEIFEVVADPRRHAELDGSGTVVGTVSGPGRLAKDATFSVKMKQYGLPYRITSKVTEFADGRVVEWRHPVGHRWRWELVPVSETATRVTETWDYSRVNPLVAKAFGLVGIPKQNAAGIEKTLRGLQARYARNR